MVLRVALWQILIGLGLGTPAALFSGHPDGEPTYGVGSYEPAVFVSATVVLGLYATVAGLIPSHRAASIEPMQALPYGIKTPPTLSGVRASLRSFFGISPPLAIPWRTSTMKLSLAFLFFSVFALCFAAGQSKSGSTVGQNSAMSTEDQQISNGPVAEYVSDSNCTIGWSTRVPGTMTLRYGTDPTKMTQTKEAIKSDDGRNHHVRLDGLAPHTRYYFRVLNGGEEIGGIGTFQTVDAGDPPIKSKAIIPQ